MQASMRKGKNLINDLFPVSTFLVGFWPQSLLLRLNYKNMDFPLQITVIAVFVTISLLHHCGRILAQSSLQHCSLRFLCTALCGISLRSRFRLWLDHRSTFTFRVPSKMWMQNEHKSSRAWSWFEVFVLMACVWFSLNIKLKRKVYLITQFLVPGISFGQKQMLWWNVQYETCANFLFPAYPNWVDTKQQKLGSLVSHTLSLWTRTLRAPLALCVLTTISKCKSTQSFWTSFWFVLFISFYLSTLNRSKIVPLRLELDGTTGLSFLSCLISARTWSWSDCCCGGGGGRLRSET